jgi:hypothetical protein
MHRRNLRREGSNKLHLMHLGAAGWEITDGERVILLDPICRACVSRVSSGRTPRRRCPVIRDGSSGPKPQDDRLLEAEVFVREVKKVSPRPRVVVPEHFERHMLPQKRRSVPRG